MADQEETGVITRNTPVREAARKTAMRPSLVRGEASILDVAQHMAERPEARLVCVVDDEDHLLGIIPLNVLVDDLFLHIMPEEFLATSSIEDLAALARRSEARSAQEIMIPPLSVTMSDTVGDAFTQMHEHGLTGLPVVDNSGKVVDYLDVLQLMMAWLGARLQDT